MNLPEASHRLIRFYMGLERDDCGRKIEDIWNWNRSRLETVHDYIQWLFPLPERSNANPSAPCLTDSCVDIFRRTNSIQIALKRSFELMLAFYGLDLTEGLDGLTGVTRRDDFGVRSSNWLSLGNHNHLRLSRIIASTRLLGLERCSLALFECLTAIAADYPQAISCETFRYWKRAASRN